MEPGTPRDTQANASGQEANPAPPHVLFSFAQGEVMQGTLKGTDRESTSDYPAPPFMMPPPGTAGAPGTYVSYPGYPPHPAYAGYPAYPGYPPYPPQQYPLGAVPAAPYGAPPHHDYSGPMPPYYPPMNVDVENPRPPFINDVILRRQANVVRFIALIDVFFSALTLFVGYWFGAVGVAMGLVGYFGATHARVFYVLLYTIYLGLMLLADIVTISVAGQVMDLNTTTIIFFVIRIIIQFAILNYVRTFYVRLRDYVNLHGPSIPQGE